MSSTAFYIFRREYRLTDNTALLKALEENSIVYCIFIFDPRQYKKENNEYFSKNSFQFLMESLDDLDNQLNKKLSVFDGIAENVILSLITENKPTRLYVNSDVTPFSIERDKNIEKVCKKNNVEFIRCQDILLNPIGSVLTGGKTPYKVFTPFWRESIKITPPKPQEFKSSYMEKIKVLSSKKLTNKITNISLKDYHKYYHPKNTDVPLNGGRTEALKHIKTLIPEMKDYESFRNDPTRYNTMLSAINKYGLLSIREVYWFLRDKLGLKKDDPLLRQLYWRDFYYNIAYYFPHVFKEAYLEKYKKIKWDTNEKWLKLWQIGKTGVPFVDAGMRQLNKTGFMHNRLRMVVSQFLAKDLFINWQKGEKYFAQQLYDYDPSQNNGGWQWSASTGTDSQPYFRVFNPYRQSETFDKNCEYIKKWVPELKDVPNKDIHNWETSYEKWIDKVDYPKPIVIHSEQIKQLKSYYNS